VSDFLAAAGVVAIVRALLQNAVTDQLSTALNATPGVTALPPDRVTVGAAEAPQLNVFLYHVSFNQGWRNVDLPSRNPSGVLVSNPPLPLDLHFLMSAYGKSEFDGEILLGWAMQVLHETPVLTRSLIQSTLQAMAAPVAGGAPVASELAAIATTTLAQQTELIRIVPESVSTEDIWKLWTAFQASYRATAAYRASVVLISATNSVRSALPVQKSPNIQVQVLQPPIINNLSPGLLRTGDVLTITGHNLAGSSQTTLVFDGGISAVPNLVLAETLRLTLPPSVPAGPRLVRVAQSASFGTSADPRGGASSNPASFMLVPTLSGAIPASVAVGATLTLSVNPPVGRGQDVALLIGDNEVELGKPPPTAPATSTSLVFTIPVGFPVAAALPLRIQVDGAQSSVALDQNGNWQPSIAVTAT
jgi:Pvc16 N-terminal domain/IPT/TIG domain